jgi:hypothetical protein
MTFKKSHANEQRSRFWFFPIQRGVFSVGIVQYCFLGMNVPLSLLLLFMDVRGTGIFFVSPMCSDSGQRIFAQQAAN